MARGRSVRTLVWLTVATIMSAVTLNRLELSFDLSAFLPGQATLAHDILVEQIRNGPSSRLLIVGIGGADRDRLAAASETLTEELASSPLFISVVNGSIESQTDEIPAPVDSYYLLMRDIDYSAESLAAAVQARLRDLAIGGGAMAREIIARDPLLATVDILGGLTPVELSGNLWFAADGSAIIIAETQAASLDIAAQEAALLSIRQAFGSLPEVSELRLDVTGVGAFSVELQETIRAEATRRSILASAALILVLLLVFRQPGLVLLAALPLAMGFLAGLTLVSLLFDTVHGITLAFGFTMLGIAIDYPLHLFSHCDRSSGPKAMASIWPTMLLGALSTVVAYLALVFAGSQGLAQLGLFTTAGVAVALLVTRTWLPYLIRDRSDARSEPDTPGLEPLLSAVPALLILAIAAALVWVGSGDGLWDDDLGSLSPVPAERLEADQRMRQAAVTPDLRFQLVLHNNSLEALLEDCERTELLLAVAREDGLLQGWQSVCQLLPSRESQLRRQSAIPTEAVLRDRIVAAIASTPFRQDAFEPFVRQAAATRSLAPLGAGDFTATRLQSWIESHLLEFPSDWAALISIASPELDTLRARIAGWTVAAELVDLQSASRELMRDYRSGALKVIAIAALLIFVLLLFARGRPKQILWVGLTVSSALATTIAVTSLVHGGLTVVHLVALLLVLGIGLDYALFLSRVESAVGRQWTLKGVLACAASTTLAFAILADSAIPMLSYLGLTVATGSASSFLLAYLGSHVWRKRLSGSAA